MKLTLLLLEKWDIDLKYNPQSFVQFNCRKYFLQYSSSINILNTERSYVIKDDI